MMKTDHARRETASDRFWREKVEECPQGCQPLVALLGLALLALTLL